jgi:FkbM family methyltransferase
VFALRFNFKTISLTKAGIFQMTQFTESHSYPSYSQAGEDRVIFYLFERMGKVEGLRYADIGAAVPAGHNNTYLFYALGGSGVLAEADPVYLPAYTSVRPKDLVEQVAVVPNRMRDKGTVTFYRMNDRGWSTVLVDRVATARSLGKCGDKLESFEVPCVTINELLEKHFSDGNLDLLSIDIEGVDLEVLSELDFSRFIPKVIVVENSCNPLSVGNLSNNITTNIKDYQLFASTYINSIFVNESCLGSLRI